MAQLRLIGDPAEVEEVLAVLERAAHVSDVSRRGSRYSETDLRVYAHVAPVVEGEILDEPPTTRRAVAPRRRALPSSR